jgi:hypothetical protein
MKTFLKGCTNIFFSNIISDMIVNFHCTCLKYCIGLNLNALFFGCLVILSFCMAFNILFSTLCTKLGLPYLVDINLAHSIYGHPIDPMGIYFFQSSHGGEHIAFHDIVWDAFVFITKKSPTSCVTWINKCPSIVFSLIFMLVGWYYVFHRCTSHYGWCDNCWSHFNIFSFVSCFCGVVMTIVV